MNIFEYLGLAEDHRKLDNKVTQLVKHWDEVPESRKKGKTFAVQLKKDGVCAITVVKNGEVSIWSRTGNRFSSTKEIAWRISDISLPDGVYFGELTCELESVSLEVLSGVVNTNTVKPLVGGQGTVANNLSMNFFDLISIESFIKGSSQTKFSRRHSNLVERFNKFCTNGHRLCVLNYTTAKTEGTIDSQLSFVVSGGEEGIVIRDMDAGWEAGHKGWRVMKKVRGVDYDLKCIDYEEGTGKYKGKVANLIFAWKGGKTIKCMLGKGWTHDMAAQMFVDATYGNIVDMQQHRHVDSPVGKIYQVYALEESSKGKLRLPKVGEQRFDKMVSDV